MSEGDDIASLVAGLPVSAHPDWMAPMLAVLTDARFSDPDWIFERKLDGVRLLAFLEDFRETLEARRRETSPFDDAVEEDAIWVRPDLVAEIGFTEWTGSGRLRHPRFLGLRQDKAAEDVIREVPDV